LTKIEYVARQQWISRWDVRSALLGLSTLAQEDKAAEEEGEEKDEDDTEQHFARGQSCLLPGRCTARIPTDLGHTARRF
jgi:hypothetical protein